MQSINLLNNTIEIDAALAQSFKRNGHAVVRDLASAQEVGKYLPAIKSATQLLRGDERPMSERNTYGKAFIQSMNLWTVDSVAREFVMAKRFAKVAADLMGVDGVRLYHDQALFKEPGGGITPWHQDHVYWPLDTTNTITMWMPLVDVPNEIGSVVFASGSHERGDLGGNEIGDNSQLHFDRLIEREKFDLVSYSPMRAGDASFHAGWALHGAPANETATMRSVMTIIYFADGTRVSEIDSPMRRADNEMWLGSLPTGALAASPLNPLLWSR